VVGRDKWVAYNEDLAQLPEMRWLESHLASGRIRLRDSGMQTLCGAIAGGIGRGILPCFVGDTHSELRRSAPRVPVLSRDVWLLIHREARESARVMQAGFMLVETGLCRSKNAAHTANELHDLPARLLRVLRIRVRDRLG